jgi:hypothetical protein
MTITAMGQPQRVVGVLFDDQHGEAVLPVQGPDRIENLPEVLSGAPLRRVNQPTSRPLVQSKLSTDDLRTRNEQRICKKQQMEEIQAKVGEHRGQQPSIAISEAISHSRK